MKKTKRLLALLLSVMLIIGVVVSVPFTVRSAEETDVKEIPLNQEVYDSIEGYGVEGSCDHLKFTTIDKDAYYTITVKNIDITTHSWAADNEVQADVLNANDEKLSNINLTKGDEKSTTLKLEPNTTYYMRVYNNYSPDKTGGNYKVQISYVLDPDKNEMENATDWKLEEKYYGDIAARGDKDWFKITTGEETDYTFTLKNTNISTHSWSGDLQFRGVLYNDKKESLTSIHMTAGEESSVRVDLDSNTEYYIAIFDPQGTKGEYNFDLSVAEVAVGMKNAIEISYNEEYYDSIAGFGKEGSKDYLKFTTIDKDAYYTINVKNINIPTHSWWAEEYLQVDIINANGDKFNGICLDEGQALSTCLKLDPDTNYFIRVYNNFSSDNQGGNYKVQISYVLDPDKNNRGDGTEWKVGEKYYGDLAASDDRDWFKITTNEEIGYTFTLANINIPTHALSKDNPFRGVIYNNNMQELASINAMLGKESSTKVYLEPNTTYYIEIGGFVVNKGEYIFDLSVTSVIDEDDIGMENAIEIPYNEEYFDTISDWKGDNKVDYLKFTTFDVPASYTITAKNININADLWLEDYQFQVKLWDEHKNQLDKLTLNKGSESSMTHYLDTNTTYYIVINNNYDVENNGGIYKVQLTFDFDFEQEIGTTVAIGETEPFETIVTVPVTESKPVVSTEFTEESTSSYGSAVTETTALEKRYVLGDTDFNGKINIKDTTMIQKFAAKILKLEGNGLVVANVNGDGKVNVKDATAIQKYLAKIETPYKIGEYII